jgi:hypothetical protein
MDSPQVSAAPFDWSYPLAFIWGLFVIASFVGWGQAIGRWLAIPGRSGPNWGWGLAAAWGMATFLVMSGPMMFLSVFSATFVALYLLAGLFLAVRHARIAWGGKLWTGPPTIGLRVAFIGLFVLIELVYGGAVAAHWYNACDDFAAYFANTKMLLDSGTLFDPFSYRLMGSLGGQQTLSALVLAFLPWKYAHLLDSGIGLLMVLGLTLEMVRGSNSKAWIARFLLVMLILAFQMPRINTASQYTGVVLFLALLRTFDLMLLQPSIGWKPAFLLGGVVAATATLRCHNIFAIAFLATGFIYLRLRKNRQNWRGIIRETGRMLGATLLLLAPWWGVAYLSSGTFLFPLIKGNQPPEFEVFKASFSLPLTISFIAGFFIFTTYLFQFLPIIFVERGRQKCALIIYGGAVLLVTIAFLIKSTNLEYSHVYRYMIPIGMAFGLYSAGIAAGQLIVKPRNKRAFLDTMRSLIAVILVMLVLFFESPRFWNESCENIQRIEAVSDVSHQLMSSATPVFTQEAEENYGEAFAQIPLKSQVLIALDFPFLLDYQKHRIYSIDVAGGASPRPGLPYFQGPAPVKEYLLAHGIRYIAHVPFDHAELLHSRRIQTGNLVSPIADYRLFAIYEIDFYNNIDELAKTNRILYDSPTIRVIDLSN